MKRLLLAATLFAALSANAQFDEKKPQPPFIEVTGTAEKEVVPDIIYISIALVDKIEGKATYSIDEQEAKLKSALKSIGIDLSNLTLANASSDIIFKKNKEKGTVQRKQYMLKVSTAAEVNKVFEALYNNNIKEADIIKVDYSKMDALRKEVRIAAVKAAKDKAIYLLEAIGEQPGKPLEITEQTNSYSRANIMSNVFIPSDSAGDINTDALDFKKIKVSFSYFIKYSIK